ncbi:hypothetical protein D3C87_858710 [compost metagenome]
MYHYQKYIVQDVIDDWNSFSNDDITVNYLDFYDALSVYVNIKDVYANPDLPWNREELCRKKKISITDMSSIELICKNLRGTWPRILERRIPNHIHVRYTNPFDPLDVEKILKSSITRTAYLNISNVSIDNRYVQYERDNIRQKIPKHRFYRHVTMNQVLRYHEFPWEFERLMQKGSISMEVLAKYIPDDPDENIIRDYTYKISDLHHYVSNFHDVDDAYLKIYFNNKLIKFDKESLNSRSDLKGSLMVYMNEVDVNTIMNNIHLPWKFHKMICSNNVSLRLALLGSRVKSIFTPIQFTDRYHDVDILIYD